MSLTFTIYSIAITAVAGFALILLAAFTLRKERPRRSLAVFVAGVPLALTAAGAAFRDSYGYGSSVPVWVETIGRLSEPGGIIFGPLLVIATLALVLPPPDHPRGLLFGWLGLMSIAITVILIALLASTNFAL